MPFTVQTLTAATALPNPPGAAKLHYSISVNNAGGAVYLSSLVTIPTWTAIGGNVGYGVVYPKGVALSVVTAGREVRLTYDGGQDPVVGASAIGFKLPEGTAWFEIFGGQQILQNIRLLADVDATKVAVTFFA